MTILQSEDQGKQVWPHGGYEKLLAAFMWRIYAGGNASASFCRNVSDLIGDYEYTERSTSWSRCAPNVCTARRRRTFMSEHPEDGFVVDELAIAAQRRGESGRRRRCAGRRERRRHRRRSESRWLHERHHEEAHHELTNAQRKLDIALEALDAAKRTPVAEDDEGESSVSLLAWSVPLTTAPPELVEWVEGTFQEYLTGTIGLVKSGRWCSRWTEHPDAVHRLAGIYDEWTLMRLRIKGAPSLHTSTARSSTTTSHNSPAASTASSNDATAPAMNHTNAWTPTSPPPLQYDQDSGGSVTGTLHA